ncbi:MAG: murein transglycosylase A [Rhodobacterales bacterium]|nr:murein transglycosylase A [Rhodobacterales bacterium]
MRAAWIALVLVVVMAAGPARAQILRFSDLPAWDRDDHAQALAAFVQTCDLIPGPDWGPICALARDTAPDGARAFFELLFRPVVIGDPPALFTGYYEPEIEAALRPGGRFRHPIYRRPPDLRDDVPYFTRAEIDGRGVLAGRGLEIAWAADPVDVFFLHIQGSGRLTLPDGRMIRVGYAGRNNHPYRSLGAELVRRGLMADHEVSAPMIRSWVRRNPDLGLRLLETNPSYVFFRRLDRLPPQAGPIGAMGRSLTPLRSVAVDPAHVPLGAPVWVDKAGATPMQRLFVAQDTGGVIKGPQRADLFWGTGEAAGDAAGRIRDGGRMVVLLPVETAHVLAAGG